MATDKSPRFIEAAKGWNHNAAPGDAIAAATAVLLRGDAPFEVLMLRRNSKLEFVGGMWVFPGGRVDPADSVGADGELGAARAAAARETGEEAGLTLDPAALTPFSHWMPPAGTPRRFSTWFFVATAPAGTVTIDGGEIHDHGWHTPAEALQRRDAGDIEMAPPTFVTLTRLAAATSAADALADLGGGPIERFETRIIDVDGVLTAVWHGDIAYDDATPNAERPRRDGTPTSTLDGPRHRLSMTAGRWTYERS